MKIGIKHLSTKSKILLFGLLLNGTALLFLAFYSTKFDAIAINGIISMLNSGMPFDTISKSVENFTLGMDLKIIPLWLSSLFAVMGFASYYFAAHLVLATDYEVKDILTYRYWAQFDFGFKYVNPLKKRRAIKK